MRLVIRSQIGPGNGKGNRLEIGERQDLIKDSMQTCPAFFDARGGSEIVKVHTYHGGTVEFFRDEVVEVHHLVLGAEVSLVARQRLFVGIDLGGNVEPFSIHLGIGQGIRGDPPDLGDGVGKKRLNPVEALNCPIGAPTPNQRVQLIVRRSSQHPGADRIGIKHFAGIAVGIDQDQLVIAVQWQVLDDPIECPGV